MGDLLFYDHSDAVLSSLLSENSGGCLKLGPKIALPAEFRDGQCGWGPDGTLTEREQTKVTFPCVTETQTSMEHAKLTYLGTDNGREVLQGE